MQALLVFLGTMAAVLGGLATWCAVGKARAEVERDRALERGRTIARTVGVIAEARGRTLQALATLTARAPEAGVIEGEALPAFQARRGRVVDEDEVNPRIEWRGDSISVRGTVRVRD